MVPDLMTNSSLASPELISSGSPALPLKLWTLYKQHEDVQGPHENASLTFWLLGSPRL